MMKKICVLVFSFILFCLQALAQEITILHTNDIHCSVDSGIGLGAVAWMKQVYADAGLPVALIDGGDAIQGAPIGTMSRGEAMVRLMNAVGYDFVIPGNHEFDYGMDRFLILKDLMVCQYYSANFQKGNTLVLPPYKIMDLGDERVAFVGVTTPLTLSSSNPRNFEDSKKGRQIYGFSEDRSGKRLQKVVQTQINAAKKEGATKVILVAHFGRVGGLWDVKTLVAGLRGVDVVIDGHSHEDYIEHVKDADGEPVVLTQTGSHLHSLGRIVIDGDRISVDHITDFPAVDEVVSEGIRLERSQFEEQLNGFLGVSPYRLYIFDPAEGQRLVRKQETNLGDFVADAYRTALGADVAIVNGGSLRTDIFSGDIIFRDVLTALPFGDRLVLKEVTGEQLLEILEFAVHKYPRESGGFPQISGMKFEFHANEPSPVAVDFKGRFIGLAGKQRRVQNVFIKGAALDLKRFYTLVGSKFMLADGGDGFSMLRKIPVLRESLLTEADAVADYIQVKLQGQVPGRYEGVHGQGRITVVE